MADTPPASPYRVAPCQGAFVVIDTTARVRIAGCRLAADGPFATAEQAALAKDALLARDAIERRA